MSFDLKKFEKAEFKPRTKGVSVKDSPLAFFFPKGEDPEFKIRNLTAIENAIANDADAKNENLIAVVEAISKAVSKAEKSDEIKKAIGFTDDAPKDIARRTEIIRLGCVDPQLDYNHIQKIGEVSVSDFYRISNEILTLTSRGAEYIAKRKPSGSQAK